MAKLTTLFKKRWILYSVIAVVVIIGAIYFIKSRNANSAYQFITVNKGSITQEVTVTGNTTPISSVDMSFQNGGTIIAVNYPVGTNVNAGNVVVSLNTSSLQAQLAQAQANVDTQKANLASLQAGATQQSVQVSETAVASAEQTLKNDYMNVSDTVKGAYAEGNNAVENQVSPMFNMANPSTPNLLFQGPNQGLVGTVESEMAQSVNELNEWQEELQSMTGTSSTSTLETYLSQADSHLDVIQSFLIDMATAANDSRGPSSQTTPSQAAAYQAAVAAATTEVDTAISSVNALTQSIASQENVVQQQIAALNLTLAGSTPQAIQAQQAQVEQAEASMSNIEVSISQSSLIAPISGVITVQNAKVGEIASPGAVVFSIISNNNLEVDSDVPEVDIGKVNVGDVVDMTLDAFPGEQFTGKVFYIDPAETVVGGVVNYLVKVSFDQSNPSIRSGLTANLNILTQTDANALILPQYAVIQNSSGAFVEILKNGAVVQVPVTLGLQDENGNIEITSGVTGGEQVLNIGLKQ